MKIQDMTVGSFFTTDLNNGMWLVLKHNKRKHTSTLLCVLGHNNNIMYDLIEDSWTSDEFKKIIPRRVATKMFKQLHKGLTK